MNRKLISLCLLPLIALPLAGDWALDFDEDFARAVAGKFDARIEYLESTGTQWVDTGIVPNYVIAEIDCQVLPDSPDMTTMFAVDDLGFVLRRINATTLSISGGNWWLSYSGITTTDRHKYELDAISGQLSVDGVLLKERLFDNAQTLTLLILHRRAQPSQTGSLRLYGAKISNADGVMAELIPVRVGAVGYLYDRVSKTLFANAGTGDFILGPDL